MYAILNNFYIILHATRKCGRVDAYCVRDKPEVDIQL